MARRKKEPVMESNGEHTQTTAVLENPEASSQAQELPMAQPVERDPRKPEVSFRCSVDRSTSIEVSIWAKDMTGPDGNWTQRSITVTRSYRDAQNQWLKGGSYRAHDLPVLMFLLNKAHCYCLNCRTDDSSIPF